MPLKSGGAVDNENMRGRSNTGLISIGRIVVAPPPLPPIKTPTVTYFSSGFEPGNFSEWTAQIRNPVIDSVVKHDGNYSSRSEDDLFYDEGIEQNMIGFGLPTVYYIHGWVRVDTLVFDPSIGVGGVALLGIKAAAGGVGGQRGLFFYARRSAGVLKFGVYDYDLYVDYPDIMTFVLGKWYKTEMKVTRDPANGTLELYVDSVLKQTITGTTTNYNWLWAGAGMSPAVSKTGLGNYKSYVDTIAVDDP